MRKPLSLFLSLGLVVSLIPMTAFAETDGQSLTAEDAKVDNTESAVLTEAAEQVQAAEDESGEQPQAAADEADEQTQDETSVVPQDSPEIVETGKWGTCPWELTSDKTMIVRPGTGVSPKRRDGPWKTHKAKRVVFQSEGSEKVVAPSDLLEMFDVCESLTSLDLSGLDTSNVTDMTLMFNCCTSLTSLDLSGLDTSNVADMNNMFQGCTSLVSLDLSGLDTSNVTSMEGMFNGCRSLVSLDLSSFDTSNVTTIQGMFNSCRSLVSLDLSSFDTSNVTDMNRMFEYCWSLVSLDLSSFDTSNVTDMWQMFNCCTSLTSLDLSSFDTSNVTTMRGMFYNCSSLASLDLSSFDTSNVTDEPIIGIDSKSLSLVSVGKKTNFELPNYAVNGVSKWYSTAAGEWYTADEIKNSRVGIADTYTKSEVPTLACANCSLSAQTLVYDGEEKKPTVAVKFGKVELQEGTDYEVGWPSDSTNVGKKK